VAKQPKNEVVVVGFNYDLLETVVAEKVRSSADRIREQVKRTIEDGSLLSPLRDSREVGRRRRSKGEAA